MHPLLITISVLMLIIVTTQAVIKSATQRDWLTHSVKAQLQASRDARSKAEEEVYTASVIQETSKLEPNPIGVGDEVMPGVSLEKETYSNGDLLAAVTRLSIRPLIQGNELSKSACRALLGGLMRHLYGGYNFFSGCACAEGQIIERLESALESDEMDRASGGMLLSSLTSAEQLGGISMGTPSLQTAWSNMLTGRSREGRCPKLTDYISIDEGKFRINVVYAARPLLSAIFCDDDAIDRIDGARCAALEAYRRKVDGAESDGEDAKALVEAVQNAVAGAEVVQGVEQLLVYEPFGDMRQIRVSMEHPMLGERSITVRTNTGE